MTGTASPANSNAVARSRDAAVLWLLSRHPATAAMLVGIGLFPNRKKAGKRLHRLVQRKKLRLLGTVSLKGGRPELVYGRGHSNGTNLIQEVRLTQVCLSSWRPPRDLLEQKDRGRNGIGLRWRKVSETLEYGRRDRTYAPVL